jgi:hypothetical protein
MNFLGAFTKLRKATVSFVMSVCLSLCPSVVWNYSAPTGRIFMKFGIWIFLENLTRITGTFLHENLSTFMIICRSIYDHMSLNLWSYVAQFMIICRSILLRLRRVSDKSYRENQTTYFTFTNLSRKQSAVYEVMWKNMVQTDRLQKTL